MERGVVVGGALIAISCLISIALNTHAGQQAAPIAQAPADQQPIQLIHARETSECALRACCLPAAGRRSLLDAITADELGVRNVPLPFEQLVKGIEAAAGCTDRERCRRAALIPLGRSLQLAAASPQFFDTACLVLVP
jgi:hypothetical protein